MGRVGGGGGEGAIPGVVSVYAPYIPSSQARISSYLTFPSPCFSSISPHGKAYKTNFYLKLNDCTYILYQVKKTLYTYYTVYLLHLADFPRGHFPDFLHYIVNFFSQILCKLQVYIFLKDVLYCHSPEQYSDRKNSFSQLFYRFCGRV
jgi:hypothetical protein